MSVASKNLFALLDEESQDAPAAPAPKQETTPQTPPSGNKSQNQRGKGPASRGGRYYQRGGKQSTAAAGEATEENASTEPRKKRVDGDQRGRGRGGRGGRGRGRGGGRGREFDRHSGTLPDSEKRVHQGWGGDDGERELQNEQAAAADATGEVSGTPVVDWAGEGNAAGADWGDAAKNDQADDWSAAPAAADASPAGENKEGSNEFRRRRQQEEEEDDNTVTFDQYLAQKKQAVSDLPKLEGIRQANEGSDDALWKNAVRNGKDNEEENYFVGKTKAAPKSKAKKSEKEFIEIEARFERPQRGGRGGRGRGGDDRRGRGGRGGSRNNNRNTGGPQVDVADEAAFPSLS